MKDDMIVDVAWSKNVITVYKFVAQSVTKYFLRINKKIVWLN